MPRLNKDQWAKARELWESDPTANFETIAGLFGVSRVAVSKRAAGEGWEKVQPLASINEAAQLRADAKVSGETDKVSGETRKRATVEAAIDVRADVLERHRADWASHRKHFSLDAIAEEFENGKKAKISAEMLLLRQKGERAAYGLDDLSDKPSAPPVDPGAVTKEAAVDAYRQMVQRAHA